MERYTRAEFIVLMIMLVLNVIFVIIIVGFGNLSGFVVSNGDNPHPSDFIKDSQISFEGNKIVVDIDDPILTHYENSGSMEPVLGGDSTGIGFKPDSPDQINVGDIVSFRQKGILIVHRVVEIGKDSDGIYFITKGDNSNSDDGKVRFDNVTSVLVGVLY